MTRGQSGTGSAFTLVELLVVVSIIAVLTAMLIPAMEGAMYQVQLVKCGSNLKLIAAAGTVYASDNQNYYPHRSNNFWDPLTLRHPFATNGAYDMREQLKNYLPVDMFLDPLCGQVDLRPEADTATTAVMSTYYVFFGWGVVDTQDGSVKGDAMTQRGQRFSYDNRRFNVVAADQDEQNSSWPNVVTSHNGYNPKMVLRQFQNLNNQFTRTYWERRAWSGPQGRKSRGPVDNNYAYDDGSVTRRVGVLVNDDNMVRLPITSETEFAAGRAMQLPPSQ
jgi:prepilin-type N-terminal cleavage/methylation domain-containing protein